MSDCKIASGTDDAPESFRSVVVVKCEVFARTYHAGLRLSAALTNAVELCSRHSRSYNFRLRHTCISQVRKTFEQQAFVAVSFAFDRWP